jgi:SHS family lactate transporter-like MFS transporter
MESWPARSRGLMSSVLQGSWALGFLASSAAYGLLFDSIGWRGLLWMGILPALVVVWVRKYVKEPEVWLENRRKQREQNRQVRLPLFVIFTRGNLANTLTACWWMASAFTVYYSIFALFATHLQKDLALSAALVSVPLMFSNAATFVSSFLWGWVSDVFGRRWSMIIPAIIALVVTPTYLLTNDYLTLAIGFSVQGLFGGAIYGQNPSYLSERFPTEVRATAAGFCYHQGAIFGGLVAPVLTYIAVNYNVGFGVAMMFGTTIGLVSFIISLLMGPETKGKEMVSDLEVFVHEPGV